MDMDGVLVHEEHAIPGADRFLARLTERGLPFLVLTNNSIYTRRDLAARLRASGLVVPRSRSSPRYDDLLLYWHEAVQMPGISRAGANGFRPHPG